MSHSSLWTLDLNYVGDEFVQFNHAWLFGSAIDNTLLRKYIQNEIETPYGYTKSLFGPGGQEVLNELNSRVNAFDNFSDRICSAMIHQQIFFAKNKKEIAQGIRDFQNLNNEYFKNDNGVSVLTYKNITERFNEIASSILEINESVFPYFIFKNTSIDNTVECWFEKSNGEDDVVSSSLKELDRHVVDFVIISDGKITDVISNNDFFTLADHEKNIVSKKGLL